MYRLDVKLLDKRAKAPTVANEGDLGYDLYSLEDALLGKDIPTKVRTGVAVSAFNQHYYSSMGSAFALEGTRYKLGLLIRDRSSMAARGIFTHGGVIDAGYTGEILVLMTAGSERDWFIKAGDKIAQMVPTEVMTGSVNIVEDLDSSNRGENGFGSSGR